MLSKNLGLSGLEVPELDGIDFSALGFGVMVSLKLGIRAFGFRGLGLSFYGGARGSMRPSNSCLGSHMAPPLRVCGDRMPDYLSYDPNS